MRSFTPAPCTRQDYRVEKFALLVVDDLKIIKAHVES